MVETLTYRGRPRVAVGADASAMPTWDGMKESGVISWVLRKNLLTSRPKASGMVLDRAARNETGCR